MKTSRHGSAFHFTGPFPLVTKGFPSQRASNTKGVLCHDVAQWWEVTPRLPWRHNDRDSVSNHQHLDCLFNCLFRRRSKKSPKLRVTSLCVGNSPVTDEFTVQKGLWRGKCFHLMTSAWNILKKWSPSKSYHDDVIKQRRKSALQSTTKEPVMRGFDVFLLA